MILKFKEQTTLFMASNVFVDIQYSAQQTVRIEVLKIRAWKGLVVTLA